MKYLLWYAMPIYLIGWLLLQTRLLIHINLIVRAVIYGMLIIGALYLEKDFTKAEFWVSLLFYLIPLIEWQDDEKLSNLLLTPIIFLVASVFIFKPDFLIMLFMIIWLIFFLFIYIELYSQQTLNLFAIRWGYLIRISSIISILSLIVFVALPRFSFGIIPSFNQNKPSVMGINDQIDLNTLGAVQKNDTVSMRIFVEGGRQKQELYWKIYVLSENDEVSWKRDKDAKTIITNPSVKSNEIIRYRILSDELDIRLLPSIGQPIIEKSLKNAIVFNENGELLLNDKTTSLRDTFISSSMETSDLSTYKEKPEIHMAPQLQAWAKKMRASVGNDQSFVELFINHLQKEFTYTLNAKSFDHNSLDQFFFNDKKGYCSHFAMALATALRANHIPANIVVGFYHGEWNEVGNYYILRNSDAHAWVEAKLDHGSWQKIDPTKFIKSEANEINRSMETQQLIDKQRYGWGLFKNILHRIDYFDAQVTGSILSYGYERQNASTINIESWKNLKSAGFIISIMAMILIVILFSFYLLKINNSTSSSLQLIEEQWIHLLEKYFGKKLIYESLNQFTLRVCKKRLTINLKNDLGLISNQITDSKFGTTHQVKKEINLKKAIQNFRFKLNKHFSANKVR
jgi:hypothetical protein